MLGEMLQAVLLAALAATPLLPTDLPSAAPAAVVTGVEIEGNRRASAAFVRSALGVSPGDPFDPAAVPGLEQRLLNRRIFREVRITPVPGEGGVVLRVALREKLTLFPVPFVSSSRGVFTGGVALLDANALGGGEQLVVGALGSNRGASAFALFRDPGVAETRWLLGARIGAGDTRRERFRGADLEYRYRERQLEWALTGGRRLDERLSVLAGWSERRGEARTSDGYAAPPRGGAVRGPIVEVELEAADQRGELAEGVVGRAEVKQGLRFGAGDRRTFQATATATWTRRVFRDHGLSLTVRGDRVGGDPVLDAARLGGQPGSRGFRAQGLWAQSAASAALEYQVPLWRPRWGALAAAGFCDAGWVRWRAEETRYVAPGAGIRLFLRNLAIPVVGLDVAWASGVDAPAFSAQVGFRR
jgi:outer membrane protein assembly factor BamA